MRKPLDKEALLLPYHQGIRWADRELVKAFILREMDDFKFSSEKTKKDAAEKQLVKLEEALKSLEPAWNIEIHSLSNLGLVIRTLSIDAVKFSNSPDRVIHVNLPSSSPLHDVWAGFKWWNR